MWRAADVVGVVARISVSSLAIWVAMAVVEVVAGHLRFATEVASLRFTRVVPAHFDAPAPLS